MSDCIFMDNSKAKELLPYRNPKGHKGSFGRVLSLSGSENMAGAAVLSAKAIYRTGAGMVKVISSKHNRSIMQVAVPECLFGSYDELETSLQLFHDVILAGPGLGTSEQAKNCVHFLLQNAKAPMVLDADALNLIAGDRELCRTLIFAAKANKNIVITPHIGELRRLIEGVVKWQLLEDKIPLLNIEENLMDIAREIGNILGTVVVAKSFHTYVYSPFEKRVFFNDRGNCGMATAGSGDVLSGIIAGLLSQQVEVFEAAWKGVALHALAGDYVAQKKGEHYIMASDLIDAIGQNL